MNYGDVRCGTYWTSLSLLGVKVFFGDVQDCWVGWVLYVDFDIAVFDDLRRAVQYYYCCNYVARYLAPMIYIHTYIYPPLGVPAAIMTAGDVGIAVH